MRSPFVVGLLSIIPGLGFVALGQWRRALGSFGVVFGLFVAFLFVPEGFLVDLFFNFAIFSWFGQIFWALQTVRLQKRQAAGEVAVPKESVNSSPLPGLSFREQQLHKLNTKVLHQLNPGEQLAGSLVAQTMPSLGKLALLGAAAFFTMRQFDVGLTQTSLVMIEQDMMGKPAGVRYIPLHQIKLTKYKKGLLVDKLTLEGVEDKPTLFQINRVFRETTGKLIATLDKTGEFVPK